MIEAVAVRPIGWARAPMIALQVHGTDVAVPAPVPGLLRRRYANDAIADLRQRATRARSEVNADPS